MPHFPRALSRRPARASFALVALAFVAACGGCGGRLDVPVPAVGTPTPLPPVELATIAIPVSISVAAIRQQLDTLFPVTDSLGRADCQALGGAVCHQYVYRREPLLFNMQGDRVSLIARLAYRGRVALPGAVGIASCGYAPESMRRATLRMATSLYWRNDWRLASRQTQLAADLADPCRVTVLRLDATPLMQRVLDAQLARLTRTVDSLVFAAGDLRPAADSLWRSLLTATPLDSTGTLWLQMQPQGASLAAVSGANGEITTRLVMTARPRVVLGDVPATESRPLPALTLAPPGEGVHVPVDIELPFATLGREATRLLTVEAQGPGLEVRDVKVWGVGDTAVVRVDVKGRLDGALYLLGQVAYDSATRRVLVRDLRYTLASAGALTRMKATLGAPLIRRALDQATGGGAFDVGAQLDSMRTMLTREMNRPLAPGVQLEGAVRDITIRGLYATPTSFVLRVVLDGSARAIVR
jgi:hypothetical protein